MKTTRSEKSRAATVKFSIEQYKMIEQRAERCGMQVGPWMRKILVQVAKRTGPPGIVRVHEPEGISF